MSGNHLKTNNGVLVNRISFLKNNIVSVMRT